MKISNLLKSLPQRALIFRNITDKEPAVRAVTFKGALKKAKEMGIENPVFMREPVPGAKHVHQ